MALVRRQSHRFSWKRPRCVARVFVIVHTYQERAGDRQYGVDGEHTNADTGEIKSGAHINLKMEDSSVDLHSRLAS